MVRARPYNKNQISRHRKLRGSAVVFLLFLWCGLPACKIRLQAGKMPAPQGKAAGHACPAHINVSANSPYTLLLALGQNVQASPGLVEHIALVKLGWNRRVRIRCNRRCDPFRMPPRLARPATGPERKIVPHQPPVGYQADP